MSETAGGCVYDGVPLDGVEVRIDDGRVVLGGETLAKGYRNPVDPDPFVEPGWFRTDDVGVLEDSGALRVLGRVDDAISTGGLTVLPQLVEAALAAHPAIADCAVFGVPDERLGQRVCAAIIVAGWSTAPTVAELRAHVAGSLTPPPHRARSTSSTSCPAAASASWTERSSPPGSPLVDDPGMRREVSTVEDRSSGNPTTVSRTR